MIRASRSLHAAVAAVVLLSGACTARTSAPSRAAETPASQAEAIAKIVREVMAERSLRAAIVKVTKGD